MVWGALKKASFPSTVTPTTTADDPTWTVMVPLAGTVMRFPAGWTPLTKGADESELVIWIQHGPDVVRLTKKALLPTE